MKQKFVDYFMRVAEETAELSHAVRRKVGCVIVKDRRILSFGYNGMPEGWDNCCEDENGNTRPEVLHAENNALMKLCQSQESSKDAVLFITLSPCFHCAVLIYQAGISEVIYKDEYRDTCGIEFLKKCGVKIWQKETIGSTAQNVMKNLT